MGLSYNGRAWRDILDRYVWKELGPPFAIGVGVFTFFLFIDRIYQLTDLVITKNVPFHLVLSLLLFMLPAFLSLTLPMALLVAVLLVCGRLAGGPRGGGAQGGRGEPAAAVPSLRRGGSSRDAGHRLAHPRRRPVVDRRIPAAALQDPPDARGHRHHGAHLHARRSASSSSTSTSLSVAAARSRASCVSDERDPQRSRIMVAREGRLLTDEANRRITLRFLDGAISETERRRSPPLPPHRLQPLRHDPARSSHRLAAVAGTRSPRRRCRSSGSSRRPATSRTTGRSRPPTTSSCTSDSRCPWRRSSSCSWASRSASAPIGAGARSRWPRASASWSPTTSCSPPLEGMALSRRLPAGARHLAAERALQRRWAWSCCAPRPPACPPRGWTCSGGSGRTSSRGRGSAPPGRSAPAPVREESAVRAPRPSSSTAISCGEYLMFLGVGLGGGAGALHRRRPAPDARPIPPRQAALRSRSSSTSSTSCRPSCTRACR